MVDVSTYQIMEFLETGVRVKDKNGEIKILTKINLPKHAIAGDIIRWSEHYFYVVIDENEKTINR